MLAGHRLWHGVNRSHSLLLLSLAALTTSCVSSDKLCKDMAPGDWLNNPLNPLSQPTSSLHPTSRANLHISSYSLCFLFFLTYGSVNLHRLHATEQVTFHIIFTYRGAGTGTLLQRGVFHEPTPTQVVGASYSHGQPQTPVQSPLWQAASWPMRCWWAEEAAQRPNEDQTEKMSDRPPLTGGTCFLPQPLALSLLTGSGVHGRTVHTTPCSKVCKEACSQSPPCLPQYCLYMPSLQPQLWIHYSATRRPTNRRRWSSLATMDNRQGKQSFIIKTIFSDSWPPIYYHLWNITLPTSTYHSTLKVIV